MHKGSSQHDRDLAVNLLYVRNEIVDACKRAKRDPAHVCLVAVSKGHDMSKIEALYHLGQRHFGESYAQEFHEKYAYARKLNLDITWHFIGALQSNKLKLIKDAQVVHSISSLRHAMLLDAMLAHPLDIFLQINLAQRESQTGASYDDAFSLMMALTKLRNIRPRGLMTIAPQNSSYPVGYWFQKMVTLKQTIKERGFFTEIALSMGMSDDFVVAIEHGSNFIRVGTKIFGTRS